VVMLQAERLLRNPVLSQVLLLLETFIVSWDYKSPGLYPISS
jgi:hypothetical protein